MTSWTLNLPYDRPPLSLNQRLHWAQRNRIARQLAGDVTLLACAVKLPKGMDRAHVVWHWQPATRRRRDTDNPMPSLKVAIDALTRYGLTADDDHTHITSECVIEPVGPSARCWLTITDLSAALVAPASVSGPVGGAP